MIRFKHSEHEKHDMEIWIGNLLRFGVMISAGVVLIGGALYLKQFGQLPTHYDQFHGEPNFLTHIVGVLEGVQRFNSEAIIQFGLLLLIATPIFRVLFSVFAFAVERDWLYVVITIVVFILLLTSLLGFSLG